MSATAPVVAPQFPAPTPAPHRYLRRWSACPGSNECCRAPGQDASPSLPEHATPQSRLTNTPPPSPPRRLSDRGRSPWPHHRRAQNEYSTCWARAQRLRHSPTHPKPAREFPAAIDPALRPASCRRRDQAILWPTARPYPVRQFPEHSPSPPAVTARAAPHRTAAESSFPSAHKASPRPAEHESYALKSTAPGTRFDSHRLQLCPPPAPHPYENRLPPRP